MIKTLAQIKEMVNSYEEKEERDGGKKGDVTALFATMKIQLL